MNERSIRLSDNIRHYARIVETPRTSGVAGAIGGIGLLLWSVLMFARFNELPVAFTVTFERATMAVFAVVALLLLVGLAGASARFVDGRLGTVAGAAMGLALIGVMVGSLITFVDPELGWALAFASYPFVVGAGTVVGISLLRTGGPRVAGWCLTVSLPILVLTDKVLWDPLAMALGVDLAAFLFVWPVAIGMAALGLATRRSTRAMNNDK